MASGLTIFTSLRYDPALHGAGDGPANIPAHAGSNSTTPSILYMPDLHRDRLLSAASHFRFESAIRILSGPEGIETLSSHVVNAFENDRHPCARRVKVTVDEHGHFQIETSPTPARDMRDLFPKRLPPPGDDSAPDDPARVEDDAWTIVIDRMPKIMPSEYTHFKTSRRDIYDTARAHAGISPADRMEVVLLDTKGNVLEGSMTTPYFWRSGRWVTPPTKGLVEDADDTGKGRWQGGQDGTTRRWALERGIAEEEEVDAESIADGEECWVSNGVRGFIWGRISL